MALHPVGLIVGVDWRSGIEYIKKGYQQSCGTPNYKGIKGTNLVLMFDANV